MFLKLNQCLFGAALFSLQASILTCCVYGCVLFLFLSFTEAQGTFDFIAMTSIYVFAFCISFSVLIFTMSVVAKKILKLRMPKYEGYLFVFSAAVPVGFFVVLSKAVFTQLCLVIFAVVVISGYFVEKIYQRTWRGLNELLNS